MITALTLLLALLASLVLFAATADLYGTDSRDGVADDHTR